MPSSRSADHTRPFARGWGIALDPDEEPKRSPNGILSSRTPPPPAPRTRTPGGWEVSGGVEAGGSWSSGDTSDYFFGRYKDVGNGGYVRFFDLTAEQEASASFLETYGGQVGRTDQFYSLAFGRYNAWQVNAFFDEIPSSYSTTYRSLWNGIGSGNATLAALTPGGASTPLDTQANIRAALATTPNSTVRLQRKTGGVRFDWNFGDNWKLYAGYTNQNRQARARSAWCSGRRRRRQRRRHRSDRHNTHDILADCSTTIRRRASTCNVGVAVPQRHRHNECSESAVDRDIRHRRRFPTDVHGGRFDLYPTTTRQGEGQYGRSLPSLWNGRFTASVHGRARRRTTARSRHHLSYGGTINGVPTNVWNTPAAHANGQRADRPTLANVRLVANPTPGSR
jgi:hypothetical protein